MRETSHPGQTIKSELENRGWTQADLIFILGCSAKTVNLLVNGKQGVSPAMSKALGEAFDLPADHFADLQMSFDMAEVDGPDPGIRSRAQIRSNYPVRDMIRRGWLSGEKDQLEPAIASFSGNADGSEIPYVSHAAKKSSYGVEIPASQFAWIMRVRQIARSMPMPAFKPSKLSAATERMRELLIAPEETRHVPKILQECGVRFVVVESLPGANIDGVCTWLSAKEPVIGMSMRYDRVDNFWFVLRHEIEHVLKGDGKNSDIGIVDADLEQQADTEDGSGLPEEERVANAAASNFCVPKEKMQSFIRRKSPLFYEKDVVAFSKVQGVHPGLVVGQLQYLTKKWGYLNKYQEPVRSHVLPSAMVDGYGQNVGMR